LTKTPPYCDNSHEGMEGSVVEKERVLEKEKVG